MQPTDGNALGDGSGPKTKLHKGPLLFKTTNNDLDATLLPSIFTDF